jgi:predicted O-methyltransferase YrrM
MQVDKAFSTLIWFAGRPRYWDHGARLVLRKAFDRRDGPEARRAAEAWAAERVQPIEAILATLGLVDDTTSIPRMSADLRREGERRAASSPVEMGGAADLDLLHALVKLSGARRVIETGVAFGWSSLAILAALDGREDAVLASVDMPYPRRNNDDFVGIVVPERLRSRWTLIRAPDRTGIKPALARLGGAIDLAHYDSDKSWQGRHFAYTILWEALVPGGIFVSDDIQDNLVFRDFVHARKLDFAVSETAGKFIGIARKP